MTRWIFHPAQVGRLIMGEGRINHSFNPWRFADARHLARPPFLEHRPGEYMVFIEEMEKDLFKSIKCPENIEPIFYRAAHPRCTTTYSPMLREAVLSVTKGKEAEADAFTPVDFMLNFGAFFRHGAENPWEERRWKLRKISRSAVLERFERTRKKAITLSEKALSKDPDLEAELIRQLLDFKRPEERFESLDHLMQLKNVDVVFATSRLNVQDIAAVPVMNNRPRSMVIYRKRTDEIQVIEETENNNGKTLHDLTEELRDPGTIVAIEEQDMTLGQAAAIGFLQDLPSLKFWSAELRNWREELSSLEVPYIVPMAKITAGAVDGTIKEYQAERKAGRSLSDHEIVERLKQQYKQCYFSLTGKDTGEEIRLSHVRILQSDTQLFVRSGIYFIEEDGMVRAVTDVARTTLLKREGQDVYRFLQDTVIERMSFSCHTNARGRDVYLAAETFKENVPMFKSTGTPFGYLMGKQRYSDILFHENSGYILDSGVIGVIGMCEISEFLHVHYQDMFISHPYKGLNLTRFHPFSNVLN